MAFSCTGSDFSFIQVVLIVKQFSLYRDAVFHPGSPPCVRLITELNCTMFKDLNVAQPWSSLVRGSGSKATTLQPLNFHANYYNSLLL